MNNKTDLGTRIILNTVAVVFIGILSMLALMSLSSIVTLVKQIF